MFLSVCDTFSKMDVSELRAGHSRTFNSLRLTFFPKVLGIEQIIKRKDTSRVLVKCQVRFEKTCEGFNLKEKKKKTGLTDMKPDCPH